MLKIIVGALKFTFDMIGLFCKAFKRAIMLGASNPLYTIVAVIGLVLRTLIFGFLSDSILEAFGLSIPFILSLIIGFVINTLLETPLRTFTFMQVGIFYVKGSNYSLGSILYTVFYFANCGLLFLTIYLYMSWWYWILLTCYAFICYIVYGIVLLVRRFAYRY